MHHYDLKKSHCHHNTSTDLYVIYLCYTCILHPLNLSGYMLFYNSHTHIKTDTHTDTHRDTHTETHTQRHTHTQTHTDTHTQRHTQTHTQRHTQQHYNTEKQLLCKRDTTQKIYATYMRGGFLMEKHSVGKPHLGEKFKELVPKHTCTLHNAIDTQIHTCRSRIPATLHGLFSTTSVAPIGRKKHHSTRHPQNKEKRLRPTSLK